MVDKPDLKPQPAEILADILVVDDTIASLRLLTEILRKVGYQVRPADGPHVALDSALAHPPSLILLDVRMPEMDGFEVCSRLKQNERTRDVPIIFVSALQDVQDRVRAFEAGGVDFISKPIEEAEVLARVKTHLQLRTMQLHLEEMVAERTAELRVTNRILNEEILERKLAEEERDRILTMSQDLICIAGMDGYFKFLNPAWERILGYTQEDLLAEPFLNFIHPDDHARLDDEVKKLSAGQPTINFENRYLHKNGSIRTISWTATPFLEEQLMYCIGRDITQRKQAEQEIRESEERYRATFEQAAVGIAHVALDGQFLHINQKFCDILGYSRAEMLSVTFQDITYPDDLDADLGYKELLLAGEVNTYSMEKRYFHKKGEIVWVIMTVSLLREDSGEPRWFVSVVEDITPRKQIEQALNESEAKYRNLVEQADDGITVIQDEKIVFANRTFAEITGRTFVAILNTPFTEYIPADDVPKIASLYQRRMDEGTPSISETTIQHKDGSQVEVEFNAGLTIFDGNPAVQVIIRDITARKQAEAALQATEEQFRQLVEQSPMSIQLMTPDGRITKVNQAFMALWGISEDSLPEAVANYSMLEDEEARQRGVMPLIEKAFKGEAVVLPEIEYDAGITMGAIGVNAKANKRWIQPLLYPVKNEKGEVVSVVEMEEDITERKQSEQQILEYQERLKALASQLTVAEEKERRCIAAELHDNVGQMLAFARMRLASARKISADAKQIAILDDISGTLQTAIEDTQNLVFDLSSPLLNEVGLGAAISEWLEQQIGKRFGLGTEFIEKGPKPALDEDVRAILFRNVRELLINVVRHADASQVNVRLKNAEGNIVLVVEDDGMGFDPGAASHTAAHQAGFGLFSIQERMNDMGGTFEIISESGQGTQAILSMPLGIG